MKQFYYISLFLIVFTGNNIAQNQNKLGAALDTLHNDEVIEFLFKVPYDKFVADLYNSEKFSLRALEIAREENNDSLVGFAYAKLSLVNYLKGNYEKSVEYNQKAIEIFLRRGDDIAAGHSFCELGYQMKRRNLHIVLLIRLGWI